MSIFSQDAPQVKVRCVQDASGLRYASIDDLIDWVITVIPPLTESDSEPFSDDLYEMASFMLTSLQKINEKEGGQEFP